MIKNIFTPFILSFLLFLSLWGCNPTQNDYIGTIIGHVADSVTNLPLFGVQIVLNSSYNTTTDSGGNYQFVDVQLATSESNYEVIASKTGYRTKTAGGLFILGQTDTVNINLVKTSTTPVVFIANNIHVNEYLGSASLSALNLYDLNAIVEADVSNKDIILRDSLGTRMNFQFLSSNLDTSTYKGYITKFSNLLGYFTKPEFDTLKSYYGASNPINPVIDFPSFQTNYFYNLSTGKSVYAFYLKGRNDLTPTNPRYYGLIQIDSTWIDVSNNFNVNVNIKLNRNGENYFIP